jgi:amino acid permease
MQWFVNSVSIFGATCVPLSLYVIPGYYYAKFYKGYNAKKYWSGLVFAIFGMGVMVTYTALEFFSYAYMSSEDT